ncbi:MAG: TIR domain-containing protein [Hyphomonadaceae bacterium]|nr:TIR domain-containing protein [Hyphomonadaceae bacterium]
MTDIFISYAREETLRAEEIRRALEGLGLSVFFDVERLDAGDVWSDVIDRELKSAGAVVALWSPHALSRPWVKKECAVAQGRGVLLPALLEPVTDLDMPTQFSDLQRADISDFHGQSDHPGWRKLVRALAKTLKRNDLLAAQIEALKEEKQTVRVKAELEAAQKELAALRKSKGGVKPAFVGAGLAVLLALGAVGAWWGGGEMSRREAEAEARTRASLIDPEVMAVLSAMPDDRMGNADADRLLDEVFRTIGLMRLIEASAVDADAALVSGWAYQFGKGGVEANSEDAVRLFRRSCDLGNLRACSNLGLRYAGGEGVARDDARAVALYARACEGGSVVGCNNLGFMYSDGRGVARDDARAAALYAQACEGGYMGGCRNLGLGYATGRGVRKDEARAAALFDQACDGGVTMSCRDLGVMYRTGRGVEKNGERAAALYAQVCDGGDARGCYNLGDMYFLGEGVAQDGAQALKLFGQACGGGYMGGCYNLGVMYETGRGVEKDEARAAELYAQACEGRDATGCNNLGAAYANGRGVERNEARAAALYTQACEGGHAIGCSNLGFMYESGTGVAQDPTKALEAFRKSCDGSYRDACKKLAVAGGASAE